MTPTILVVEDDASQRELLCELLEAHGYACVAAEDGRRALDVIDRRPAPDAVVLDMVLPRLNGHEFLRELGERGERRLGVVVVSGFGPVSRFADRVAARPGLRPEAGGPRCPARSGPQLRRRGADPGAGALGTPSRPARVCARHACPRLRASTRASRLRRRAPAEEQTGPRLGETDDARPPDVRRARPPSDGAGLRPPRSRTAATADRAPPTRRPTWPGWLSRPTTRCAANAKPDSQPRAPGDAVVRRGGGRRGPVGGPLRVRAQHRARKPRARTSPRALRDTGRASPGWCRPGPRRRPTTTTPPTAAPRERSAATTPSSSGGTARSSGAPTRAAPAIRPSRGCPPGTSGSATTALPVTGLGQRPY